MEAFDKKYVINYDKLEEGLRPIIQANIEECRRKAANEIAGTTGLDFWCNEYRTGFLYVFGF